MSGVMDIICECVFVCVWSFVHVCVFMTEGDTKQKGGHVVMMQSSDMGLIS